MLLKEYITYFIKEAISYSKLNLIVRELNNININYKSGDKDYSAYYDLIKVVDKFGLKKIGAGAYRKVYSLDGEDWVLKFAYGYDDIDYLYALSSNADEVAISLGDHGMGARDIFVQVYEWDKLNEKPTWIIAQKVVSLSEVYRKSGEEISFADLQMIFPTFWDALYSDSREKNSKRFFCDFISDVMFGLSVEKKAGQNTSGLNEEGFYIAMEEASIDEGSLKPFEAIKFDLDFNKIAQACAYSRPDDMHSGNIGIIPSGSPSPKDIVILDYSIDY